MNTWANCEKYKVQYKETSDKEILKSSTRFNLILISYKIKAEMER